MSDDSFFAHGPAGGEPHRPAPAAAGDAAAMAETRQPVEVGEWTELVGLYVVAAFLLPLVGTFFSGGGPYALPLGLAGGWLFAALGAAAIGARKGRSAGGFLLFGFALPYVALVAAMLLDVDARERAKLFAAEVRASGPQPAAPPRSEELGRLAELHRDGTLTDDEFAELKRQLIAGE